MGRAVQGDLSFNRSEQDGVQTLSVRGDLDLTASQALLQHLEGILSEGHEAFAVDLSQVRFCDSHGARVILKVWRESRSVQRPLRVTGASHPVRRVFNVLMQNRLASMVRKAV